MPGVLDSARSPPQERLVIPPQPAAEEGEDAAPEDDETAQEIVELTLTYSEREALRQKDFADLTPEEFAAIKRMMADMVWELGRRRTRRYIAGRRGLLDTRRSLCFCHDVPHRNRRACLGQVHGHRMTEIARPTGDHRRFAC